LFVHLRVGSHPTLRREGTDLHSDLHVAMTQAALGLQVDFETLDSTESLTVPAGCESGHQLRLRGRGVPHLQSRGRGDLVVTVMVDTPTGLSRAQEDLLRQLAAERGEDVAAPDAGLLSKIRGAFK
jgi:molecular chaperone DnaJ